jgi:SlyX protein
MSFAAVAASVYTGWTGQARQGQVALQRLKGSHMPQIDPRLIAAEEKLAHLERVCDDLSQVVARQEQELARLSARVQMLLSREAERESDESGTIPLADQRPPHW